MTGLCLYIMRFILSSTFHATSSILLAALAASFLVGLLYGIIKIAMAPAAALIPAVIAHPLTLIFFTPFSFSMPTQKKIICGKILPFHYGKTMI